MVMTAIETIYYNSNKCQHFPKLYEGFLSLQEKLGHKLSYNLFCGFTSMPVFHLRL